MDTQENYNELKKWWTTEIYVAAEIGSILLSDRSLRCLWRAIDLAITILFKSCSQEAPGQDCTHTEDEHVLMFLGCRAFTSSLSPLKLLFSGYYQQA